MKAIRAKGASLEATEQPINTSAAAGKAFLGMLGVFAEFETSLRKERPMEEIAKAKMAKVYQGGLASIDAAQVKALKAGGMSPTEIAKRLGIGRASVYRVLEGQRGGCGASARESLILCPGLQVPPWLDYTRTTGRLVDRVDA